MLSGASVKWQEKSLQVEIMLDNVWITLSKYNGCIDMDLTIYNLLILIDEKIEGKQFN